MCWSGSSRPLIICFEAPIDVSQNDYTMIIADGKAEAKIDSVIHEANPSMREAMHDAINHLFLGVQLLNHRSYDLSISTMTRDS